MFANDLGIDVWEAIDAAATKPFGFMKFTPGPGVGGHCLPIDPSYLSWQVRRSLGHAFRFVELANDINEHMPDYVVLRLMMALNERGLALRGRRVLLLGLSYKKNTGDIRESPSSVIARRLLTMGAELRLADPHIGENEAPAGVALVDADRTELGSAMPSSCWSTTTRSTSMPSWRRVPTCSTRGTACPPRFISSGSERTDAPPDRTRTRELPGTACRGVLLLVRYRCVRRRRAACACGWPRA